MLGKFIAKKVAGAVIKKVMEKRAIKKMREYVEQPNELDIQVKVLQKNNAKLSKENEEMQKEIAILRRDSHPPIFSKEDMDEIIKRVEKLEKGKKNGSYS